MLLYAVFHLALSNMLPFANAMLPFMSAMFPFLSAICFPSCAPCCPSNIQTVKCLSELLLHHIQPTQAIVTLKNTQATDVSRSHL